MPEDSVSVNISPSKIVTPLACRFSFVLSEIPLLDDNPCFKMKPDAAPMPTLTSNSLVN